MGKTIRDEDLRMNLIVNGDEGLKEMGDLKDAMTKLKAKTESLNKEKALLNAESKKLKASLDQTKTKVKESKEAYQKLQTEADLLKKEKAYLVNTNQTESKAYEQLTVKIKRNEEAQEQLKHATASLKAEQKQAEAEHKKLKNALKEVRTAIRQNEDAYDENSNKLDELRKKVGLSGLSMKELRREARMLRTQLDDAVPGTSQWLKYRSELRNVEKRLAKVSKKAKGVKGSLSKMADGFNKYFGMVTAFGAVAFGFVASAKEMLTGNAKLSDSYADIAKTTGLSMTAVKALDKQLKSINTRTSREELRGLAEMAGKLGIQGKKDVFDFVKAADKINVALGKDLGGSAEEAIKQVGKLVDIFKVKDEFGLNQGMEKVGSVINSLGAASTANEGYIVEFTKRLAGIAPTADISIQNVMGLAATLDSLGQTSEVASTVFSQLIPNMFKDVATYAKMAGKNTEEFSRTLSNDANEALIQVLEGLHNNSAGLGEMANKLSELGLEGKKNISVIGVMANNTETLRKQQALANEEFKKGTSLTNEFNLKNNNLAANLDKIGKRLKSVFVNSAITSGLKGMVSKIEEWTRIPLAKAIEEEQQSVAGLVIKLTDVNTKAAERKRILNELKSINPKITEGLEAENIEYEKLKNNVAAYNDQVVKRIVLANLTDEEKKAADKQAGIATKRVKKELEISQHIYKANVDIATQKSSLNDKIKSTIRYLIDEGAQWDEVAKKSNVRISKAGTVIDLRSEEQKMLDELVVLQTSLVNLTEQENKLKSNTDAISEKVKKAKELLGVEEQIVETRNDGGGGNGNYEGNGEGNDDAKQKAIADRMAWEQRQKDISDYFNKKSLKAYTDYLQDRKSSDEEFLDYYKRLKKREKQTAVEIEQEKHKIAALERETAYLKALRAAGDNEQKKAEITRAYRRRELEIQQAELELALEESRAVLEEINKDAQLDIFGEKKKAEALARIAEIEKRLEELKAKQAETEEGADTQNGEDSEDPCNTEDKKKEAEERLKERLSKLQDYANEAKNLHQSITDFRNKLYENELKEHNRITNKKIQNVRKRVKDGILTEEEGEKQIENIKKEALAKEDQLRKQQFEMNKSASLVEAIINTAVAVTAALKTAPPAGYVLAALSAASGAAEIATIASSEYTPQAEEGGYTNVIGAKDRKQYRAKTHSQTGGYFAEPTLLVGEKPEYVIPNEGLQNPYIARMLPAIEEARTSGTLRDISKEALWGLPSYSKQMAEGGYASSVSVPEVPEDLESNDTELLEMLRLNVSVQNKLAQVLEKGVYAKFDQATVRDIKEEIDEQNFIRNDLL